MLEASAPAKAILFGEHAVVYGKPAIAVSLDRRMTIIVKPGKESRVDGGRLTVRKHRYVRWVMENLWDGPPLEFRTRSDIPSASGLGSSAALCSSVVSALSYLKGPGGEETNARNSFEVEYNVQGGASPTDTSCSTHGHGILVSFEPGEGLLWSISKKNRTWYIHHIDPPGLTMVVGYTKKPSITPVQVEKVRSYYDRSGFARETIEEIGELVFDALAAMKKGDTVELGALMDSNHSLLSILGVSSRELNKLRDAASPYSYGAKMTGAGGGGSIIALTDRPEDVCRAIKKRGGVPYIVSRSTRGAEVRVTDEERFVNFNKENTGEKG